MEDAQSGSRTIPITPPHIRPIFFYFTILTLLLGVAGGLSSLPVNHFLKDILNLGPRPLAVFMALTLIPTYLGFLFGFLRDRWRPFGLGDRGYMLLTLPVIGCLNLFLSLSPLTYHRLQWNLLLQGIPSVMLGTAVSGLTTSIAQHWRLSGRLVALSGVVMAVPGFLSAVGGGWLSDHTTPQFVFRICAILYFAVTAVAFWRPRAVFAGQPERHPASTEPPGRAILRVLAHRPLWPAMLIVVLFEFAPGWNTPLTYFERDIVHLGWGQIGDMNAVGVVAAGAVSALYGVLCRRFSLKRLLWMGIVLSTIVGPAYLLIHSFGAALIISIVVSGMLGIGVGAIDDLLLRSYPAGLEGTGSALIISAVAGVTSVSDVFGSWLYSQGGFVLDMEVTTVCTALSLPVLLLLPRRLIATHDGEIQARDVRSPALTTGS